MFKLKLKYLSLNLLEIAFRNQIEKVQSANNEEQFDLPNTPAAQNLMKG